MRIVVERRETGAPATRVSAVERPAREVVPGA